MESKSKATKTFAKERKRLTENIRQQCLRKYASERLQYQNRIANLHAYIAELEQSNADLSDKCAKQQEAIQQLQDWNDRLLEFTELSKEDIRTCVARDKKISNLISMFINPDFARINDMFEH